MLRIVNLQEIDVSRRQFYLLFFCLSIYVLPGCKKFVQIDPPISQITAATTYSNNTTAAAVMTGIYDNMVTDPGLSSGSPSIGYLEGLAADELTNYSTDPKLMQFYQNALTSSTSGVSNYYFWTELYNEIHVANTVLEGLQSYSGVTPAIKLQLTGEALFMRAFLHFYAVNLYGDVPLVTTANYLINNTLARTPKALVYKQIIQDLLDAQTDLGDGYVDPSGVSTTERVRPNKGAATALLARVYLYTGDWPDAEAQSTLLINNASAYSLVNDLNSVFLANSVEAIWQLPPVNPGYETYDGYVYVLTSQPQPAGPSLVALSPYLLNAFEAGDNRLTDWIGIYTPDSITFYYYPFKYKVGNYNPGDPISEYTMVLRLGEQYLIRSEARIQQGNISGAQADLNAIRSRAGLSSTAANDKPSLLTAILHERQVELFTEWGHRWFDLIRTDSINEVLGSPVNVCQAKGGSWNLDWILAPIPQTEIQINSNLTQNPGY